MAPDPAKVFRKNLRRLESFLFMSRTSESKMHNPGEARSVDPMNSWKQKISQKEAYPTERNPWHMAGSP
jgi:hypothetical protein